MTHLTAWTGTGAGTETGAETGNNHMGRYVRNPEAYLPMWLFQLVGLRHWARESRKRYASWATASMDSASTPSAMCGSTSTCTVSPSRTSPASSFFASASPIAFWIRRRSGRAP